MKSIVSEIFIIVIVGEKKLTFWDNGVNEPTLGPLNNHHFG